MLYEITIVQKTMEKREGGQEWELGAGEPREENDGKIVETYGYTPNITVEREVSVQILKQCVNTLDLATVIKAINGL